MREYSQLFIGGTWVSPSSDGFVEVLSPADQAFVGRVPAVTTEDIDRGVAAAREAFDNGPWPRMSPAERGAVIARVSELLAERGDELAHLISEEMGAPLSTVYTLGNTPSHAVLDFYAGLADSFPWEETRMGQFGQTRVVKEPLGVVAAITAWNVPMFVVFNKLAPALLAGCTVVIKPALETPLSAFPLAQMFADAGLPEGVLSVLPGGAAVGEHLVNHPLVDKVTFTGSTAVGRRIGALCGERLKSCSLELGGKSAAIVLQDADLDMYMPMLTMASLMNSGQACVGQTRILVPRSRAAEITEAYVAAVAEMKMGHPSEMDTELGPLISARQRDRVEGYIASGKEQGARLALGGGRPAGFDKGFYVEATIFDQVDNSMKIAQEEIFGPVISIITYDTEDEAIRIANDSSYGLAGSVWTSDVDHGIEVAKQVRAGTYGINWYAFDMGSPFGGYKNSGIGRENGPEGLDAFCETKSIIMPMGHV
ncbi:aldehyde dehydrogenase [Catelliglobosispora koreensis]|uniref:aldehyde dehydrogenase n=1 Tax=Catelliglobosispora koreensis TaxID=129052 RepID=UPI000370D1E3|nr:aldehyde dehydrogenase [Catelliglobosispora koreensis]